jgi:uncharacterized membrane protein
MQPVVVLAYETEGELVDVPPEGVEEGLAADGTLHRYRVLGRHPAVLPAHGHYVVEMGQREFSADVTINCSPERAFDYFADHRHVAAVLDGISKWDPIGEKSQGVGARYDVEMVALGFPLKSTLRLNRWRRPHEIGWVSETGLIKQEGGFTFTKVKAGVHIVLRIAYTPPAAMLGAAIAGRMDWLVKGRLQTALERIRTTLESG